MRTDHQAFEYTTLSGGGQSSAVNGYSPAHCHDKLLEVVRGMTLACEARGKPATSLVQCEKRDDVTRVPVIDGWRKPTPYAASWDRRSLIGSGIARCQMMAETPKLWSGRYYSNYNSNVTRDSAVVGFKTAYLPSPSSNTENALLAKCYSAIQDKTLDVGMLLLESRESFGTVLSYLRKLRAIVEAVRHKDVGLLHKEFGFKTRHRDKKTGKYTKDAGSLWLEAFYGAQPIIMDIFNAVELVSKELREKDFLMVARARSNKVIPAQGPSFVSATGGGFGSFEFEGEVVADQSVALWFHLDRPGLALASSLGLTNPVGWLYEKTPLSFVLDWILPLGQVISQLDSTLGFSYKGGSHSFRAEGRGMVSGKPMLSAKSPSMSALVTPPTMLADKAVAAGVYSRKVYDVPPTVTLFVKNPFKVTNIVTTVALITGRTVR